MKLKQLTVKQSLNKAYRLIKPERADIDKFKSNFKTLLGHINPAESEENMKGHVMDFLKNTWYSPNYHIATKGRTDFVIHTGKDATHPAGVLFEAKKPSSYEMITTTDLNRKAMHEVILYYLRERIEHRNNDIKYLVITNIYEWFVFDAPVFERLLLKNSTLVKEYKAWMAKQKVSTNNDLFYNEIAKPFLRGLDDEIEFTWFDIREYEKPLKDSDKNNDTKLIPLFKVLSPTHLLKLPFANDSNTLDKRFYNELLYIIGLEEIKEGSKKLIRRKQEGKRIDGSLLENTIVQLETENCLHKVSNRNGYGENTDDQLFSVALELCITWVNRVLFLKLLEAQLLKYHKGNEAYRFLNYKTLPQYDELYKLFFQVLARKSHERADRVGVKYKKIPYLNSSLFDITPLEEQTIRINMLDGSAEMPLLTNTVLKDDSSKPLAQKLNTLQYLFDFLNAYDFASEGSEEIQEERKTLINASVLGLIFEKINGYKDGSIFTPGFITMYMCRHAIRQAVVNKFKEKYNWKVDSFEDLHNYVSDDRSVKAIKEYNALINSLTICDPAVGSGHFLVSALNELIAIKSELGILADANGKRLTNHIATVENDELLITDKERNFFTYYVHDADDKVTIPNSEMQRVQAALFHEKQRLIENSLFGVDINPKSVQICRLRLWIELLKNAYYISDSRNICIELQTLPNIDINIKTGNSLVSRFNLDEDLKPALAKSKFNIQSYKLAVQTYKDAENKEQKSEMQQLINTIKNDFTTELSFRNKLAKSYVKVKSQVVKISSEINRLKLWKEKIPKKTIEDLEKASSKLAKLEKEVQEIQNNKIYTNAFEWRFEFPEVLDDEGNFLGFDVVIGNPPYISSKDFDKLLIPYLKSSYTTSQYQLDLYVAFIERSLNTLKKGGIISLITPNSWLKNLTFTEIRKFLLDNLSFKILFPNLQNVFQEASVDTLIFLGHKNSNDTIVQINEFVKQKPITKHLIQQKSFLSNNRFTFNVEVSKEANSIFEKIQSKSVKLQDIADITRGVNPYDKYAGHSEQQIKNKVFHASFKKDETFVPEIRGKHVNSYYYRWDGKHYISYGDWLAAPRERKYFSGERLIMRQVLGKTLLCTVISEDLIIDQSIFIAKIKDEFKTDYLIEYIQGILGSKLLSYYFRHSSNEFDALFPKIKIGEFRELPIPKVKVKDQAPIIKISSKLLKIKEANENADTSILQNEIDKLVYQIYNLTPEEISIVEQTSKETPKTVTAFGD